VKKAAAAGVKPEIDGADLDRPLPAADDFSSDRKASEPDGWSKPPFYPTELGRRPSILPKMNAYVIYSFVVAAALSAPATPQTRPDFTGTWTLAAIRPAPKAENGGSSALPPSDLTITQTPTQFSTSRTYFEIVNTATHDLTGRESTNKSGAVTRVTKARWVGATLVIEGKASQVTSQGYAAWTLKETYSLDAQKHLLIESDYKGDDGKITHSVQELIRKKGK
jgi:hypothetical protein